jgi:hypothetical protein
MKEGIKVAIRRKSTIQNSTLIIHNFPSILSGFLSLISEIGIICGLKISKRTHLKNQENNVNLFLHKN